MANHFKRSWATLVIALIWTSGCNLKPSANYDTLNLVQVSGRVTLNGKPLPKAVISFDDAQDGTFSYGLTDSNGIYSLKFDSEVSGVKPGKKIVRISTARKILGLNDTETRGMVGSDDDSIQTRISAQELVSDKYNKNSELVAEVSATKRTFNFDLK
jgi:hypothetical protein